MLRGENSINLLRDHWRGMSGGLSGALRGVDKKRNMVGVDINLVIYIYTWSDGRGRDVVG